MIVCMRRIRARRFIIRFLRRDLSFELNLDDLLEHAQVDRAAGLDRGNDNSASYICLSG
jgi:hypothetical protein